MYFIRASLSVEFHPLNHHQWETYQTAELRGQVLLKSWQRVHEIIKCLTPLPQALDSEKKIQRGLGGVGFLKSPK